MSEQFAETEHRVTPFELFFDLVFVFGFTEVTTLLREDPTQLTAEQADWCIGAALGFV